MRKERGESKSGVKKKIAIGEGLRFPKKDSEEWFKQKEVKVHKRSVKWRKRKATRKGKRVMKYILILLL